eukprot:Skav220461  [mRNA]  locus=scaffold4165:64904:65288:- [translate_table: standard]
MWPAAQTQDCDLSLAFLRFEFQTDMVVSLCSAFLAHKQFRASIWSRDWPITHHFPVILCGTCLPFTVLRSKFQDMLHRTSGLVHKEQPLCEGLASTGTLFTWPSCDATASTPEKCHKE